MHIKVILATALLLTSLHATADGPADLERGRFIVRFGGCNDCHTDGYMAREGKVPESEWLTGSPVGFQGPWGTSYAANLRLRIGQLREDEWITAARARRQPPMPWFTLAELDDADLRAVYRYVRSLGPAGEPAPAYVAPGGKVTTPFIVFVPQMPVLPGVAKVARER